MKRFLLLLPLAGSVMFGASGAMAAPLGVANQTSATATVTPTLLPTATPTLKPGPTTAFFVLAARFEHNWAGKDWNVKKTPLKTVKPGTKVELSVYFNVSALPAGSSATIRWTVNRGGHAIYNRSFLESIPRTANYKWYITNFPLVSAGTYKLTVQVELNGITDKGSAKLKVKK
jgi:hypothetical protein